MVENTLIVTEESIPVILVLSFTGILNGGLNSRPRNGVILR